MSQYVVPVVDVGTANALMFGTKSNSVINYLQSGINTGLNMLTDVGKSFVGNVQQMFNYVNSSEAIQASKAAIRNFSNIFVSDNIALLLTIDQLQNAKPVMQRWIMAQPDIRQLYLEQKCDGYSNTYVNNHGDDIKDTHLDYKLATDGLFIENEEGGYSYTIYYGLEDDLAPDDNLLTLEEKVIIHDTWEEIAKSIKAKIDPTSVYGEKL